LFLRFFLHMGFVEKTYARPSGLKVGQIQISFAFTRAVTAGSFPYPDRRRLPRSRAISGVMSSLA